MGDPLSRRSIDGTHRYLDDENPSPHRPNQNLHLKLVSPGLGSKVQGFRKGVNAKSGLRIRKPSPARSPDPEISESSAPAAGPRYISMPHARPFPYHKGSLSLRDCPDQGRDIFWIVLSVGINRDGPVRYPENCGKPCKQRSSFALILFIAYNCDARKGTKDIGSGVCRSIIHHNHGQPELETFLYDPPHFRSMIIGGNDNGTAKRYGHKMRGPGNTGVRPGGIFISIPPQGSVKTTYQLPPPPPPKPLPEEPPPPKPPPLPPPLLPLGAENMAELRSEVTELRE
jgi:hypothetical protein